MIHSRSHDDTYSKWRNVDQFSMMG